jgi:hypothetical protein
VCLAFRAEQLASSRRLAGAGVAFAAASSIKAWAVAPFLVLVACVMIAGGERRWRATRSLVTGGLAGGILFVGPFIALAPRAFFHDVIVSQIGRVTPTAVPLTLRLSELAGLTTIKGLPVPRRESLPVLGGVVGLLGAAALITAVKHRGVSLLGVYAVGSALTLLLAMLLTGSFYYHYPSGLAPFVAVALGVAVGAIAEAVAGRSRSARRTVPVAAAVLGLLCWSAAHDVPILQHVKYFEPAEGVDAVIPPGACVFTDVAAITLLSNRFVATSPSCPTMVDLTGTDLALDDGHPPGSGYAVSPALARLVIDDLRHSSYAIISAASGLRMPWTPTMRRVFHDRFRAVARTYGEIYVLRRSVHAGRGQAAANNRRDPIPFNSSSPRSVNSRPEPATRSRVVADTITSPAPPAAAMRAPTWTAMPRGGPPR